LKWLATRPRWTFHFTPTSASWLNAVEGFFSTITRGRIRRGVFKSVADLEGAISQYIKAHNKRQNPSNGPHQRRRSSKSSRKPLNRPNESVH
jgi:hypothetical protein